MKRISLWLALCGLALSSPAVAAKAKEGQDKIPVTTASPEARDLYLKGRELAEALRATDARKQFEQAVEKDKGFALAWLALAQNSGTTKEFLAALEKAVASAGGASEGEKLLVQAAEAGARGDAMKAKEAFTRLAKLYPNDERAQNLLAGYYFGQQDYPAAIEQYKKATTINPQFSQPYNQLGYAYRFTEQWDKAEATFKKYIELVPNDPNPYDSYGELLMKMGRFEDSIASYQKALALDPHFNASHIGIGNDDMFLGKYEDARKEFGAILAGARTDGEKRQALFWMAESYIHEGATDKALAEAEKERAVAVATGDVASQSQDVNFEAQILLEAGRLDEAAAKLKESLELSDKAEQPQGAKDAAHRFALNTETRLALARKDIAGAKAKAAEYGKLVRARNVPNELRLLHEIDGVVALAEKKWAKAVTELTQATTQDPRVSYELALAHQGKGDAAKAKDAATRAANFNGLAPNYAYVRRKAQSMLGSM
jgi:tetratricopeptide (TPR) repeat protein